MPIAEYATLVEGPGPVVEDRSVVAECQGGIVVGVADGAGGSGGGAWAADQFVSLLRAHLASGPALDDPGAWSDFLSEADAALCIASGGGETTALVLALTPDLVCGASVGDSEAWLLAEGVGAPWSDLTSGQRRKPLLGSGAAAPVAFARASRGGTLLAGSDGLFKYAPPDRLRALAVLGSPGDACRALADAVRTRSGTLQDDVTAVVCRRGPAP